MTNVIQPAPVMEATEAQMLEAMTVEAYGIWRTPGSEYAVIPSWKILKSWQMLKRIHTAADLRWLLEAYLEEYSFTPDGRKLWRDEFQMIPEWNFTNIAAKLLRRQVDPHDMEVAAPPDTTMNEVGDGEATCILCGRKFVPRTFQKVMKDGTPTQNATTGEAKEFGNFFANWLGEKLALIAVCGLPPMDPKGVQCYEVVRWKLSPKFGLLGLPKRDALDALKVLVDKNAEYQRKEDAKNAVTQQAQDALSKLGVRPAPRDNRPLGDRMFGGGGQGGGQADRSDKRNAQSGRTHRS